MAISIIAILKRTLTEWNDDEAPKLGAALAFYSILSMGPLLLLVISISGMVLGHEAASGAIVAQLRGLVGEQGAKVIEDVIAHSRSDDKNILATIIGVGALLFSVSGFFAQLQGALNAIFNVPKLKTNYREFILKRVLSFGMVVGIAVLLLMSLAVSAALTAFTDRFHDLAPALVVQASSFAISLVITTLLFALTFKVLPDVEIGWSNVWAGAFITASLFTAGKSLIGVYLGHSALSSTYGAAGSLIVLLVWIYYSTQIIFFGAEFTQSWAEARGHAFTLKAGLNLPKTASDPDERAPAPGPEEKGLWPRVFALTMLVGLTAFMEHYNNRRRMPPDGGA